MKRVALRGHLVRPYRRVRFYGFGKGSIVHRPEWIYGPQQIEIGEGTVILGHAWMAVERSAWDLPKPVLKLGDGVWARPNCTISAAESVVIEDEVLLGAYASVIDSDHKPGGDRNVLWNPIETSPVRIGRGTWIGDRVAVLRGSDIGRRCIIGANSVVKGAIPDDSVAVGAPARVVGSTDSELALGQLT
jgi:carbonic anhydrase/acetyltransferase-like protein (isoleucine patch superfamily)